MLVLSRRLGQSICIGDKIIVTVESIARGQVKLSIQAPRETEIWRAELVQEKKESQK